MCFQLSYLINKNASSVLCMPGPVLIAVLQNKKALSTPPGGILKSPVFSLHQVEVPGPGPLHPSDRGRL